MIGSPLSPLRSPLSAAPAATVTLASRSGPVIRPTSGRSLLGQKTATMLNSIERALFTELPGSLKLSELRTSNLPKAVRQVMNDTSIWLKADLRELFMAGQESQRPTAPGQPGPGDSCFAAEQHRCYAE